MTSRMLVAGVGNIFLGDDGFGVEVARRLAAEDLPEWVRVADYGISGLHLAYDLANGYETTILLDATSRGDDPGTVYVIELDHAALAGATAGPAGRGQLFDAHGMQPDVVFGVLDMLGANAGRVLLVGCEPAGVDYGIGLSPPVTAAVGEAVRVVKDLIAAAGAVEQPPAGRDPQPAGRDPQPAGRDPQPAGRDPQPAGRDPQPAGGDPRPAGGGSR
jgi:hydrogenase maturation protease